MDRTTEPASGPSADSLRRIQELMSENYKLKKSIQRSRSMGVRWENLHIASKFEAIENELDRLNQMETIENELDRLNQMLVMLKSRLDEFDPYFRSQFVDRNSREDEQEPLWRDNAR